MGQVLRAILVLAMLAAGALPLAAFDGPTQSKGGPQKAPADAEQSGTADAKSKAATQAEKLLDRGIKAYEAGEPNQAIRAFTTALDSGGLPSQQMARALYYRGLAYAKREMPGLAISDLTNAAWIKDGLSPAERQEALQARAAAYRAAGISDVPTAEAPGTIAGADSGSQSAGSWEAATNGSGAWGSPSGPAAVPPAAPQSQPAPAAKSSSSSGGGVTGFFNSIFGGGSSSSGGASGEEGSVTTSSIGGNAPPAPAAASWSQSTEVAAVEQPAPPPAAEPPAAAPPPPPPPPPAAEAAPEPVGTTVVAAAPPEPGPAAQPAEAAAAPSGRYHIQIAAVRSRSEAYALSVRLLSQYGQQFGARRPQIDEKVIGSMGTFYRVRVGPFASADESRELCTSLQSNGLDCLIVTQ
jgi:cell division septation protein DedD